MTNSCGYQPIRPRHGHQDSDTYLHRVSPTPRRTFQCPLPSHFFSLSFHALYLHPSFWVSFLFGVFQSYPLSFQVARAGHLGTNVIHHVYIR
ncbi:hypothetical protein HPG69_012694 [Diceros bicornis minor]|uniref:Uncharacterized protein n=1 Tax=Diceros bicornis minor TaxID=77932 RepID=A0A7J7EI97_DICBM|nr:hypothetical protein HPG69_012694 [Diceros bicornis minor]